MMKKYLIISALILLSTLDVFSQRYSERKDPGAELREQTFAERSFFGGNTNILYNARNGLNEFYFELSPLVGYRLGPSLAAGVMATYKFYNGVNRYYNLSYQTHVWGGGAFARLHLGKKIYFQAEAEYLNTEAYNTVLQEFQREWIPVASLGLGYGPWADKYSYAYVQLSIDFIKDPDNPYPWAPLIPKIGMIIPFVK
jgi:hypothetical protein